MTVLAAGVGLLLMWTAMQVAGFGLVWWARGGMNGIDSYLDALYYSGVVFFTLGFGEVLPTAGFAPTKLVLAWAPSADTERLNARFAEWEHWASSVVDYVDEHVVPAERER